MRLKAGVGHRKLQLFTIKRLAYLHGRSGVFD